MTLSLRAETLGDLTSADLGGIGLAASLTVCTIQLTNICPTWDCTGCYLTCGC